MKNNIVGSAGDSCDGESCLGSRKEKKKQLRVAGIIADLGARKQRNPPSTLERRKKMENDRGSNLGPISLAQVT